MKSSHFSLQSAALLWSHCNAQQVPGATLMHYILMRHFSPTPVALLSPTCSQRPAQPGRDRSSSCNATGPVNWGSDSVPPSCWPPRRSLQSAMAGRQERRCWCLFTFCKTSETCKPPEWSCTAFRRSILEGSINGYHVYDERQDILWFLAQTACQSIH